MKNKRTIILGFTSILTLLLCGSALTLSPASLWLTTSQQAQRYFDHGDYEQAAALFSDPLQRGIAFYAAENFDAAADLFSQVDTAAGAFDLGNTYCHLEKIPEAIKAYEQALTLDPNYPDAQFNLEFAQLLLPPKRPDDAPDDHASFDADEIRFDNTENKGVSDETEMTQLSDEQINELWMRRVQTTPADFLRVRFQYDIHTDDP